MIASPFRLIPQVFCRFSWIRKFYLKNLREQNNTMNQLQVSSTGQEQWARRVTLILTSTAPVSSSPWVQLQHFCPRTWVLGRWSRGTRTLASGTVHGRHWLADGDSLAQKSVCILPPLLEGAQHEANVRKLCLIMEKSLHYLVPCHLVCFSQQRVKRLPSPFPLWGNSRNSKCSNKLSTDQWSG